MRRLEFSVNSPDETQALGARLARLLKPGDCVLLQGELGVGKTTLARGLLRELGVTGAVRSPTFNLVHEYATKPRIAHADLYRLAGIADTASLGLDELLARGALLVEWPERAPEMFLDSLLIRIEFDGDCGRRLQLEAASERGEEILEGLSHANSGI